MMFKIAIGLALLICSRLHRYLLLHPKLHRAQVERLVRRAMLIAESLQCLFGTAVAGRCDSGCGALSDSDLQNSSRFDRRFSTPPPKSTLIQNTSVRHCGLTAGAKLRRCVLGQDDRWSCCSFTSTQLLLFKYTFHRTSTKQRAQLERLGYAARLRDALVESSEQVGVSDELHAVDRHRPIV